MTSLRDELTGLHVERRKQWGRAMPPIVVRATFDLAGPHRQHGLRAVQRLNLRFLVHAEHDRMRRWMHVRADDVAHLLDEQRVRRQLEGLGAMRGETVKRVSLIGRNSGGPLCRRQ